MSNLTGKTIGQLALLSNITDDTLFPVEYSGMTFHIPYSAMTFGGGFIETTYSELVNNITSSTLNIGSHYLVTDFKTCYDQPDFDYNRNPITNGNYKDDSEIQPIIVFAISSNTISDVAYQPHYPNDRIRYDWTFSATEVTQGVAYGRITERIDEFNNRTDYDHRQIKFKRYPYYEIQLSNPYQGTVEVQYVSETVMSVIGTDTNFTSLNVGDKVGFDFDSNYKVFEVTNIDSDSGITISGLTYVSSGSGEKMYPADTNSYTSYYQNNLSTSDFVENYTFSYDDNQYYNNYIGNFSNLISYDENTFILANNVFKGSTFRNNTFGDGCYNNTFDDDCENNVIGNYFYNNITDDDFDGNLIGNWFTNNNITSNFQYNRIGESFENNYLVQNSFYRNNVMNNFENNQISNDDFQNNEIGNQFNNNKIKGQFYKNDIGNGYNNNEILSYFYGNLIGNGFNYNKIYCGFYENKIGDLFEDNTLGDQNNIGSYSFNSNDIGNQFNNNTCLGTFSYNRIGSYFFNNIIGDGFGYGFNTSQGNVIGNYFYDNSIGEYFYNNIIVDGFYSNTTSDYYQLNNIQSPISGFDFSESTHVYGNYNCTIFKRSDGNIKLSYFDLTDTLTITDINT